MSKAPALTTDGALDAHDAGRAVLSLAVMLALLVAAVLSFADHVGEQPAPDEIAQFGD